MANKTGLHEAKKPASKLKVGKTLLKVVGVTIGAGVALIAGTNKIMTELTKEKETEEDKETIEDKLEKEDEENGK